MTAELCPVRIDTATADEEGVLVFVAGRLVAVLVRLSDQHGDEAGRWFLEHGFGHLGGPHRPVFPDLGTAERWVLGRHAEARSRPGSRYAAN